MAGFDNDVVYGTNVDFRGTTPIQPQVLQDGELLIGAASSPNIRVGNLTSLDGSIAITNGPGTIDIATTGDPAITSFNIDANTAPGTDPVVPDANGEITVTGGQVATGIIGANVIRTNSLAANTYTVEIQQTEVAAAKDTTLNGVAHFNSAQFTNDEGFISAISPSPGTGSWVFISEATASNSATIDFTSGIDATYQLYMFQLIDVVKASATTTDLLLLRLSDDGGMSYFSTNEYSTEGGLTSAYTITTSAYTNDPLIPLNGRVFMYDPASSVVTSFLSYVLKQQGTFGAGTPHASIVVRGGMLRRVDIINAARFLITNGNITSGRFRLYGWSE